MSVIHQALTGHCWVDPRRAHTPSRSTKHTIKHNYIKPINPIYWLHIIYLIEANLI